MDYRKIITIELGKGSDKPYIRSLRTTSLNQSPLQTGIEVVF